MGRSQKGDREGNKGPGMREVLRQTTPLDDAAQRTCDRTMAKMSNLLMLPLEILSASKSMFEYGMDSLVAVKMRNWLLRELDCALPIPELLANTTLIQLSVKIVEKSKFINPAILENDCNCSNAGGGQARSRAENVPLGCWDPWLLS